MSSRPCNRCVYEAMLREVPAGYELRLVKQPLSESFEQGVAVYQLKPGEAVPADVDGEPPPGWVCWFGELPDACDGSCRDDDFFDYFDDADYMAPDDEEG